MPSCSKSQVRVDEQITTFEIKEHVVNKDGKLHTPKAYEVLFIKAKTNVYCICHLFQHKGILCRHALYVLNEFVDEIPSHYILPRWRKDFKRKYVESCESLNFEASNPVQRYGIIHKREKEEYHIEEYLNDKPKRFHKTAKRLKIGSVSIRYFLIQFTKYWKDGVSEIEVMKAAKAANASGLRGVPYSSRQVGSAAVRGMLLLDEATSTFDTASEKTVKEAVKINALSI
ncbi:hypothetical protein IFM89_034032 [Coptis chinensis]|uniref:Protein FAR1-RELATED SEQUENCE n=1 Tax=Coptis chinensis TaxID=261450 RepID=A0A835IUB9_9MAGN|nr:hypothetical protein IFM89_034032 [Coptis chinensis]